MAVYHDPAITGRVQSDAEFRDWVERIHDAIEGVGLVQTSDTGQINRATVLAPTSSFQSMGYEIFRFNDAMQSGMPIFIKVEYGSAFVSGADTRPGLWITVGTATDGAGTISAQATTRFRVGSGTTASASAFGVRSACSEGYFTLIFSPTDGTRQLGVFIERGRDSSGTPDDDHANLLAWSGTDGDVGSMIPVSGSVVNNTSDGPLAVLGMPDNLAFSAGGAAAPHIGALGLTRDRVRSVARGLVVAYEGGTAEETVEVTIQGETLRFIQVSSAANIAYNGSVVIPCIPTDEAVDRTFEMPAFISAAPGGGGGGAAAAPPKVTNQLYPR